MTVGHEFFGIVEKVGSESSGIKVGQRVSAEGHIICGKCRNCRAGRLTKCKDTYGIGVNRPGCFSEYISVPVSNVWTCSDKINDDI